MDKKNLKALLEKRSALIAELDGKIGRASCRERV